MARIIVFNNDTNRMENYYRNEKSNTMDNKKSNAEF